MNLDNFISSIKFSVIGIDLPKWPRTNKKIFPWVLRFFIKFICVYFYILSRHFYLISSTKMILLWIIVTSTKRSASIVKWESLPNSVCLLSNLTISNNFMIVVSTHVHTRMCTPTHTPGESLFFCFMLWFF